MSEPVSAYKEDLRTTLMNLDKESVPSIVGSVVSGELTDYTICDDYFVLSGYHTEEQETQYRYIIFSVSGKQDVYLGFGYSVSYPDLTVEYPNFEKKSDVFEVNEHIFTMRSWSVKG